LTEHVELIKIKANKQSVANALHRKANKLDLQKAEEGVVKKYKDLDEKIDKMLQDVKFMSIAYKDMKNQ
jgi:transcription termination factor NusB